MKNIIISATLAIFALGVAPTFADNLDVKVVKTKIPEGCEYKKIPGKKKKELVCIDEMQGGGANGGDMADAVDVGPGPGPGPGPACGGCRGNGVQDKTFHANNGKGNGTTDGTPGNSLPKDLTP